MPHTTKVVETLQIADGIISIAISCCEQHGEWRPCPNCGEAPEEERGCESCNRTFLEPHPHGGQFPVTRPGMVKDPDTRSWNTFHLIAHEADGSVRLRSTEELQAFIDANHQRVAALHAAAEQATAHAESLRGQKVEHK